MIRVDFDGFALQCKWVKKIKDLEWRDRELSLPFHKMGLINNQLNIDRNHVIKMYTFYII